MNEDLLNVMGSFSEISLDCIEKQNEEIEQLQQERDKYKSIVEGLDKWFKSDEFIPTPTNHVPIEIQNFINDIENKIKELEEGVNNVKNEK